MLIDWFTVFAQIVNFLILIYLLKRFLYRPVLNAIEKREKRIAAQLENAAKQKKEAQEEKDRFELLNQDLAQKKQNLLQEARSTAEAERQRLIDEAREEYARLREDLRQSLNTEGENLGRELKLRTQREVFDIARKALSDLADATLESQIVDVFLQRLSALSQEEKGRLRSAFQKAGALSVHSAFDLSAAQREAVTQAVRTLLGADTQVQFRISPEEVGGIEFFAGGYKISWTIAEYLDRLETRIRSLTTVRPVPKTADHDH